MSVGPPGGGLTPEERVLGGARRLRAREAAQLAGVSTHSARRLWRALGLPVVAPDAVAFTEADVEALTLVSGLVRDQVLDDTIALALVRAVGRSVDRLASWQVQLLGEAVSDADALDGELATEADLPTAADVIAMAPVFADAFEPLVTYAWRRHLASALRRFAMESAPDASMPTMRRAVGFADLVAFTRLVRRLTERELSGVVQRFETVTSDIIHAGNGRVIKTVGDEVLFVAWPPRAATEIGLRIADRIGADPMLPEVRVGIATGEVLARLGDVFGTTVNLASRITGLAQPGHVLCDEVTARANADDPDISCTPLRRRSVKGIGQVSPWLVTWANDEPRYKWRFAVPGLGP